MENLKPSPLANRPRTKFSGLIGDLPQVFRQTATPDAAPTQTVDPTPYSATPVVEPVIAPATPPVPTPEPWLTPELAATIRRLSAIVGLAKVFSNHTEIAAVLDKLQIRLINLSNQSANLTEDTISGLDRCAAYFTVNNPTNSKSLNKSGALLNFAASVTELTAFAIDKVPGVNPDRQLTKQFLKRLTTLLLTLEQWEYLESNLLPNTREQ
jgi:hypothetical protein